MRKGAALSLMMLDHRYFTSAKLKPLNGDESACSEETELSLDGASEGFFLGFNLDHVESNCLGEGSALADSDGVTFLNSWECW